MKIVILGSGRVGARLARLMEADGHQISIIDADISSFQRLPENFKGQTVLGTGIDVDVLKAAGIETADAFAAVTNFDNTNIMACQVAKEIFGVPKVLARIYDPGREDLYHELGLETICPTTLISTTAREILLAPEGVEVLQIPPHTEDHAGGPPTPVAPDGAARGGGVAPGPQPASAAAPPQSQPAQAQANQQAPGPVAPPEEQARRPVPNTATQPWPFQPKPQPQGQSQAQPQPSIPGDHPNGSGRGLRAFFRH